MTQPEALRLADWLLDWLDNNVEPADLEAACVNAAAKLRCLYAENNELLEALKDAHEHIFVTSAEDCTESNRVLQVIKTAIAKAERKT